MSDTGIQGFVDLTIALWEGLCSLLTLLVGGGLLFVWQKRIEQRMAGDISRLQTELSLAAQTATGV